MFRRQNNSRQRVVTEHSSGSRWVEGRSLLSWKGGVSRKVWDGTLLLNVHTDSDYHRRLCFALLEWSGAVWSAVHGACRYCAVRNLRLLIKNKKKSPKFGAARLCVTRSPRAQRLPENNAAANSFTSVPFPTFPVTHALNQTNLAYLHPFPFSPPPPSLAQYEYCIY